MINSWNYFTPEEFILSRPYLFPLRSLHNFQTTLIVWKSRRKSSVKSEDCWRWKTRCRHAGNQCDHAYWTNIV